MKTLYVTMTLVIILLLVYFSSSANERRGTSSGGDVVKEENASKRECRADLTAEEYSDTAIPEVVRNEYEKKRKLDEEVANWWKASILFYGEVMDENNRLVDRALVKIGVNDSSREGYSEYKKTTDAKGLFVIAGLNGKHLHLDVSKRGYYSGRESFRSYQYAGPGDNYTANPNKPEIFRLRKKGVEEPLIYIEKRFDLPINGGEQSIDLYRGKLREGRLDDADLIVSFSGSGRKPDYSQDWALKFEVPNGGGLIESDEEFMFTAPASGYQTGLELANRHAFNEQHKFYIKLPDERGYARIEMDIYGQCGGVVMHYYINPTSRNLEHDHMWPIKVKVLRNGQTGLVYPTERERQIADEDAAHADDLKYAEP